MQKGGVNIGFPESFLTRCESSSVRSNDFSSRRSCFSSGLSRRSHKQHFDFEFPLESSVVNSNFNLQTIVREINVKDFVLISPVFVFDESTN